MTLASDSPVPTTLKRVPITDTMRALCQLETTSGVGVAPMASGAGPIGPTGSVTVGLGGGSGGGPGVGSCAPAAIESPTIRIAASTRMPVT